MTDIINDIDALIDEQLDAGEPRTGYNYGDPTYPRCWHCGRHWHGLRITQRIARMYALGQYDPDYSITDDTSPVLCEGSEFIGPMRPPPGYVPWDQMRRELQFLIVIDTAAIQASMRSWREAWERTAREFAAMTAIPQQVWQLPDDPFDPSAWLTSIDHSAWDQCRRDEPRRLVETTPRIEFGPQWWHCETQHPPRRPRTIRTYRGGSLTLAEVWTPPNPLEAAVRDRWHQFTAPQIPTPTAPGYDFSRWSTPDQSGPTPHRADGRPITRTATTPARARQHRGRRKR